MLLILLLTLNYSKNCPEFVGEKALKLIAGVGHLVLQMSRQNFLCFHKLDFSKEAICIEAIPEKAYMDWCIYWEKFGQILGIWPATIGRSFQDERVNHEG